MTWSPDYHAEFKRRQKLLNKLLANKPLISGFKLHYKHNPVDFIQDWIITEDPRNAYDPEKLSLMPMLLFPRQIELIYWFLDRINSKPGTPDAKGAVLKSRDIGATWIFADLSVWLWLFYRKIVIGWGSNKAEQVDKIGDPNCIFSKIRSVIQWVPSIMMPNIHRNKLMLLENMQNGSAIVGKSGDEIGRGGRSFVFINDEKAHYEHAESREAALMRNTDHIIDISTPNGIGNVFYNTVTGGVTPVFTYSWKDDPRLDLLWYNNMKKDYEAKGLLFLFNQEVDMSFTGSIDKQVIPQEWVEMAIDFHLYADYDIEEKEVISGQDISDGGGDMNAQAIRKGIHITFLDVWAEESGRVDKTALRGWNNCIEHGVECYRYDCIGVGSQYKNETDRLFEESFDVKRFDVKGWSAAGAVIDPYGEFMKGKTNRDMFENAKSQAYWLLRQRFYKTYQVRTGQETYPAEELISISSRIKNLSKLQAQLSQPKFDTTRAGRIIIEKTPKGTKSPDMAESVVICYAPIKENDYMGY